MRPTIQLWPNAAAPYSEQSPDQAQPSLAAYPVQGAEIAVIVVPGGGYVGKADHEGGPVAERLNAHGIAGYVLDYRVKPCHHLAPLTDGQRAVRVVRGLGYKYVGILGFSAGANLACNVATHFDAGDPAADDPTERASCRPDFFVPCYPVASFTQFPNIGSVNALLPDFDDMKLRRFFSAELNVTPDTPPAYIWHTSDDGSVPVENSLLLAASLSRCGVPFELHVFPHGRHGIGLAPDFPDAGTWPEECARFIEGICDDLRRSGR